MSKSTRGESWFAVPVKRSNAGRLWNACRWNGKRWEECMNVPTHSQDVAERRATALNKMKGRS